MIFIQRFVILNHISSHTNILCQNTQKSIKCIKITCIQVENNRLIFSLFLTLIHFNMIICRLGFFIIIIVVTIISYITSISPETTDNLQFRKQPTRNFTLQNSNESEKRNNKYMDDNNDQQLIVLQEFKMYSSLYQIKP